MPTATTIPFYRAQGAGNDFLFTWRNEVPASMEMPALARAICHRNFGLGADGWYVISKPLAASDAHASIHLYNSDGSEAELSGNGTRCAAAVLVEAGLAKGYPGDTVRIKTGVGLRELRVLARNGHQYQFEMAMGRPVVQVLHADLAVAGKVLDVALVDVGNPQCAVDLGSNSGLGPNLGDGRFAFDWQTIGAAIEAHPSFPRRSNVSFFCRIGGNAIAARFFERGAGATLSSGTGATGAAVAAQALGLVKSPVVVQTEAGDLQLRWENDDVFLAGPAQVIARGEYYVDLGEA